jgi:hypothetical protein
MIPPYQQRGKPISPADFNSLIDEVKSNKLTSLVGGNFNRSIGGTAITVFSTASGGGGGGASASNCPFQVQDVSKDDVLTVEIGWGLVWNMLPTGMFPDNKPPLRMDVTKNCYVYSKVVFNTTTLIPSAISFSIEEDLVPNTSSIQYTLIAVVTVDEDADPKVISSIRNICQQPFPSPCALAPAT